MTEAEVSAFVTGFDVDVWSVGAGMTLSPPQAASMAAAAHTTAMARPVGSRVSRATSDRARDRRDRCVVFISGIGGVAG